MEKVLFKSWRQWGSCMLSGVKSLGIGIMRIVYCLLMGIVSLIVAAWRAVSRFVGRNPDISMGCFLVITALVWMMTFAKMRARAVGAEMQRDSIAWQYQDFKEKHGYE